MRIEVEGGGIENAGYVPPLGPLRILHRDDDLLVVAKPEGLLAVPGKGPDLGDSLETRLRGMDARVLLVHRLDRDTSGVMVFARRASAQRHLGLQFEKRRIDKRYVARIRGRLEAEEGVVDQPLCADWPNRPRQMISAEGRRAVTGWRVLCRDTDETRVALFPQTGRSHQLRVHMAWLGHPIVGDPLYGRDGGRSRMMLHAEEIGLRHPTGGAPTTFGVACPF